MWQELNWQKLADLLYVAVGDMQKMKTYDRAKLPSFRIVNHGGLHWESHLRPMADFSRSESAAA